MIDFLPLSIERSPALSPLAGESWRGGTRPGVEHDGVGPMMWMAGSPTLTLPRKGGGEREES